MRVLGSPLPLGCMPPLSEQSQVEAGFPLAGTLASRFTVPRTLPPPKSKPQLTAGTTGEASPPESQLVTLACVCGEEGLISSE